MGFVTDMAKGYVTRTVNGLPGGPCICRKARCSTTASDHRSWLALLVARPLELGGSAAPQHREFLLEVLDDHLAWVREMLLQDFPAMAEPSPDRRRVAPDRFRLRPIDQAHRSQAAFAAGRRRPQAILARWPARLVQELARGGGGGGDLALVVLDFA